ncbi:MAG: PaaI family thioesterase [Reyranellaceae bacterium]
MNQAAAAAIEAPPGWRRIAFEGVTFNSTNGPFYARREAEDLALGFRVQQRHCNPAGILHGGMMMTMADMTASFGAALQSGIDKFMPTVSMSFDFVASGRVGDWVEGRCRLLKLTRSLAFTAVSLSVAGKPLLRASCVMKIPSGDAIRFDRSRLLD